MSVAEPSSSGQTDACKDLFLKGQLRQYRKGEIIVRPDDEPDMMYCIKTGFVKVYSVNSRGEQYVHIVWGAEEMFPLAWLVNRTRRNVYYEALTNCEVMQLSQAELAEKMQQDAALTYSALQHTTKQFEIYNSRIDNLEYKFASERLAYRLLFLASRFGERHGKEIRLLPPITQQVLASTINLSRESVTREMEKLNKKGLVVYNGRQIILPDIDGLIDQLKGGISPDWWGLRPSK
jgi:CRP/FNR family transcriptional regulator